MKLSRKERISLVNQFEILKNLDLENKEFYEKYIEILSKGFQILYSQIYEHVYEKEMEIEEGELVLDVLSMYGCIDDFIKENQASKIIDHHWGYFRGFDGHNEINHQFLTRFLIEKQGKYIEQLKYKEKTNNWDTHSPTLIKYSAMIKIWKKLGRNFSSVEDVMSVLDAR